MSQISYTFAPPRGWYTTVGQGPGSIAQLRYIPDTASRIVRGVAELRVVAVPSGGIDRARQDVSELTPDGILRNVSLSRSRNGDILHVIDVDARPTPDATRARVRCRSLLLSRGRDFALSADIVVEDPQHAPGLRAAAEELFAAFTVREESA